MLVYLFYDTAMQNICFFWCKHLTNEDIEVLADLLSSTMRNTCLLHKCCLSNSTLSAANLSICLWQLVSDGTGCPRSVKSLLIFKFCSFYRGISATMKTLTNLGLKSFFDNGMNGCTGVLTLLVSVAKINLSCFADDQ